MNDLVTWLRAQLDEDERVARAVEDRSAPWDGQWKNDSDRALRTHNGWVLTHNGGKPYATGLLDHIARHDPARALAEVEAKRLILDAHEHYRAHVAEYASVSTLSWVLRRLALPYADRPGYDESWRP